MLTLVKPKLEDLWFLESLLADEETMLFNARWGGTILFPKEKWASWYEVWVKNPGLNKYYRYLMNEEHEYVGEIAYHYDCQRGIYMCDIKIMAKYRNKGYGTEGIKWLCDVARNNGITVLYDNIVTDNPSYHLFLKNGFEIDYKNEEIVMVKRIL